MTEEELKVKQVAARLDGYRVCRYCGNVIVKMPGSSWRHKATKVEKLQLFNCYHYDRSIKIGICAEP